MEQAREQHHVRLWPMIPMAITVGALAAMLVLGFRWLIESGQQLFLPGGSLGNYESLPPLARVALPVAGGLALALIYSRIPTRHRDVGIAHVLSNVRTRGMIVLPFSQACLQFFAGALAIVSGHSVDREGPSVHLGAALGNMLARRFRISASETRLLTMTGVAAGVAAALNTPLTGVIFAVEVMGESLEARKMLSILTGAVTAAMLGRMAYGTKPAFAVPELDVLSSQEFLWIILLGIFIGGLAVLAITGIKGISNLMSGRSVWLIFIFAGLSTGILGLFSSHILGISYDTVEALLFGQVISSELVELMIFKLAATVICIGCSVPGGLIGPCLVIGGAAGGLAGKMLAGLGMASAGSIGFYAMTGMCAMLGATLAAPLTAITALFELTGNPHLILAGMLALVAADSICWRILGTDSVFQHLLSAKRTHADK